MENKLKIRILGCGGSGGVPLPNGYWGDCDPNEPKNRRLRPSIFMWYKGKQILVDTGPDVRQQLLSIPDWNGQIDAVIYTHAHADHIHGIDDLRAIFYGRGEKTIPIYGTQATIDRLQHQFWYIFEQTHWRYPATVTPTVIDPYEKINIEGLDIQFFEQIHGDGTSEGFRIGDFVYSTDVSEIDPDKSYDYLRNIKLWILDVFDAEHVNMHMRMSEGLRHIDALKPEMTYLTHQSIYNDYQTLCDKLPEHIRPAYDGQEFEIEL